MKKLVVFLMVLGLVIAGSGLAQASLSWQTTPTLGFSTVDTGDVLVYTRTGVVNIPHNNLPYAGYPTDLYAGAGSSMNFFYVGETVDAGSGIFYDYSPTAPNSYHWSVTYTGPGLGSPIVGGEGDYSGTSLDGFVMNYNDPLGRTLLLADVGIWNYTETWTNTQNQQDSISYSTSFTVGVPEPATMLLLGLGLVGLAGARRKFKG